jgi:hypothetical protein
LTLISESDESDRPLGFCFDFTALPLGWSCFSA